MKHILTLILVTISLLSNAQSKQITLEDIWKKGTFGGDYVRGFSSFGSGESYRAIEKGDLVIRSFKTGKRTGIYEWYKDLSYHDEKLKVSSYKFSKDNRKILLYTEPERIYRRSAAYKVFVYNVISKETKLISQDKVLHATFSPTSDQIAFVKNNNLYTYQLANEITTPITTDGSENIINGNCDWVYEEEFGFTKAFQWSPDGRYLAFYRFDQTKVPEFTMMYFRELYPEKYQFKYPKAGDPNSKLKIGLYSVQDNETNYLEYEEEYIPRIKWTQFDKRLVIYTLNRHQNQLRFYKVNPRTLRDKVVYEETNKYYIDISDEITFLKNENAFLFTSEKSGYNHIYYHDMDNDETTPITTGEWEVTKLFGLDENGMKETVDHAYYMSTEVSPLERNLYAININTGQKKKLTPQKGWHSVSWGKGFRYFIDNYSTLNTPSVYSVKDHTGKMVRELKDNEKLKEKMRDYNIVAAELIKVPISRDVYLNGWIIKPNNMEPGKKYPLIMFQYSGPGSQQVANKFSGGNFWWHQMLAQQGYVVACVDGRGTGYRGEAFKKMTYLQLGRYETDDQIAAAKYLGSKSYIDKSRIGIWGWSYGGYMSSICIAKGADVFKSAIAVAPVTNWRYYDNIYTERYMRTPQENPEGYDDNSPINMVDQIKGNYLLIHGSGDDNVHYQNTMEMINALIKEDVEFDSEIYPNRNHGIYGGNTRYHLYKKMTKFWLDKL